MFPGIGAITGGAGGISGGNASSGVGPVSQDSAFGPVNIGGLWGSGANSNKQSIPPVLVIAGGALAVGLIAFLLIRK